MESRYPEAVDLMFVAVIGALFTVALRSGSFAPLVPTVTRAETPKTYWFGLTVCAVIVLPNLARLLLLVLHS